MITAIIYLAASTLMFVGGMWIMFVVEPVKWTVVPYTGVSFKHDGNGGCLNCGSQLGYHKHMTAECQ